MKSEKLIYPTCRYCGKAELPVTYYENQEEADEAATSRCNCSESLKYRIEQEKKRKRQENIPRLCERVEDLSEYCTNKSISIDDETRNVLLELGTMILDGHIGQASVKLPKLKINISINAKDVIVLSYTYAESGKIEV